MIGLDITPFIKDTGFNVVQIEKSNDPAVLSGIEMIQGCNGAKRVKNSIIRTVDRGTVFAARYVFLRRLQILFCFFQSVSR